jgi:hypothetical protein
VITNVRESLAVSKQAAQQFHVERFNVRKLSELEAKKQYQIKISNRFAALENCNESEEINRVWENIKENIKTSANNSLGLYKLKQHKPWFDVECSGLLDQWKHAKVVTGSKPKQCRNLNNVRCEASRHFRNKKKGYLKAKIDEI